MKPWPLFAAVALCSCYHYSVAGNTGAVVSSTRVIAVWGIFDDETPVPPPPQMANFCAAHPGDFACQTCPSGVADVRATSNYLYALTTVVTLGFVNLLDVSYRCAPQTGSGAFPLPKPP